MHGLLCIGASPCAPLENLPNVTKQMVYILCNVFSSISEKRKKMIGFTASSNSDSKFQTQGTLNSTQTKINFQNRFCYVIGLNNISFQVKVFDGGKRYRLHRGPETYIGINRIILDGRKIT